MNTLNIYSVDVTAKKPVINRVIRSNAPTTLRFYVPAVSAKDAARCIREMMQDGELLDRNLDDISRWYSKPYSTQCSLYAFVGDGSDAGDVFSYNSAHGRCNCERCCGQSSTLHIYPCHSASGFSKLVEDYYSNSFSYWFRKVQCSIFSHFRHLSAAYIEIE